MTFAVEEVNKINTIVTYITEPRIFYFVIQKEQLTLFVSLLTNIGRFSKPTKIY